MDGVGLLPLKLMCLSETDGGGPRRINSKP